MKYTIFFTALFIGVPIGVGLLSWRRSLLNWLIFGMVMTLCLPTQLSIAFLARPFYPQLTRGFEIHAADLGTLVLFFHILLHSGRYKPRFFIPLMLPLLAYLAIGLISWMTQHHNLNMSMPESFKLLTQKGEPKWQMFDNFEPYLYPLFELSLIAKGTLLYWTSVHIFRYESARNALAYSIVSCIFYLTMISLYHRYGLGFVRVSAHYSHTNILNSFLAVIGMLPATLALARRRLTPSLTYTAATLACLLVIVLTVSRSSLAGFGLSGCMVLLACFNRYSSMRNVILVIIVALAVVGIGLKSADTFIERLVRETYGASVEERGTFLKTAAAMAQDNILGVGQGNYSALAWLKYATLSGGKRELVHNIWYLHMAELGYIGMLVFGLIWLRFYQYSITTYFATNIERDSKNYAWFIGAVFATIPLQVQNLYHHAGRHLSVFLVTHMLLGLAVAVCMEEREKMRVQARAKRLSRPAIPKWNEQEALSVSRT